VGLGLKEANLGMDPWVLDLDMAGAKARTLVKFKESCHECKMQMDLTKVLEAREDEYLKAVRLKVYML
jgi:hypothetical protein